MTAQIRNAPSGFLDLSSKSFVQQSLFVVAGTLVLALASKLSVPMIPVPITMQTFAVTIIGALYGWRLGTLTVLAWLGEAMLGMPVLAGGSSGLAPFVGPTAGYLVSFPIMVALVGFMTEKGINGHRPIGGFLLHLSANALGLALGWAWLAGLLGAEKAWIAGVAPFILGAVMKSALAAAVLKVVALRAEASK
ncbi:biotin transporter BioY [Agrobacterium rosae]|uniref:Biotin transporter n=1 Tax=Agrobacterium rosae TaxID=1972867 RepID=A0AAE5VPI9_9HYPH|nr:biotin transporter BioY [Agrobacterium rosae]KAA3514254.1 biotin transporter BioY [Agrobacterium rosae]KAA3522920.1 biotin transporter BioY [Agrobacterium rosae]MCM2433789.1 biotin transporter BioY [Agrobacterium rosae]MDX8330656.1 biotin transporter BioY [Agrobacterium rosae]MQB47617.1 biotin transporter BioY [Agrobacterium rosae]